MNIYIFYILLWCVPNTASSWQLRENMVLPELLLLCLLSMFFQGRSCQALIAIVFSTGGVRQCFSSLLRLFYRGIYHDVASCALPCYFPKLCFARTICWNFQTSYPMVIALWAIQDCSYTRTFFLWAKNPQTNSVHYFSFVHVKERIGGKPEVCINGYDIHTVRLNELDVIQIFLSLGEGS